MNLKKVHLELKTYKAADSYFNAFVSKCPIHRRRTNWTVHIGRRVITLWRKCS